MSVHISERLQIRVYQLVSAHVGEELINQIHQRRKQTTTKFKWFRDTGNYKLGNVLQWCNKKQHLVKDEGTDSGTLAPVSSRVHVTDRHRVELLLQTPPHLHFQLHQTTFMTSLVPVRTKGFKNWSSKRPSLWRDQRPCGSRVWSVGVTIYNLVHTCRVTGARFWFRVSGSRTPSHHRSLKLTRGRLPPHICCRGACLAWRWPTEAVSAHALFCSLWKSSKQNVNWKQALPWESSAAQLQSLQPNVGERQLKATSALRKAPERLIHVQNINKNVCIIHQGKTSRLHLHSSSGGGELTEQALTLQDSLSSTCSSPSVHVCMCTLCMLCNKPASLWTSGKTWWEEKISPPTPRQTAITDDPEELQGCSQGRCQMGAQSGSPPTVNK